jgi:hypothetical protein
MKQKNEPFVYKLLFFYTFLINDLVMDPSTPATPTPSGKQRRKMRRVGRRPARLYGPEWTT